MQIIEQLKNNKGTISRELSKRLALEVHSGNMDILSEANELTSNQLKNKK